jgi:hypothetical protein
MSGLHLVRGGIACEQYPRHVRVTFADGQQINVIGATLTDSSIGSIIIAAAKGRGIQREIADAAGVKMETR